jgi:ATP-dependent RNA helicase RhlE
MTTFSDLIASPVLRKNLASAKFVEPTPIQAQAIPPALLGLDIVATAQTGTGKTLAFSLPIIEILGRATLSNKPQVLVLTPTRELAIQIYEAFTAVAVNTGIRAAVVVGGMSEQKQLQAMKRGVQVVIATPGRLCDFLKRRLVALDGVKIAVLDEADRMLDMGFIPDVERILKLTATERQTLFFSATFETGATAALISKHMNNPTRITVGSTTKPAENIEMHVYQVDQDRKLGLLNSLLKTQQGSFLVFARTKHGAEKLAKKLAVAGVKSTAIHGDRSQNQRNAALKGFQDGQYRVLVATDVAARGIHVDNIAHVVNYDLPQAPEDFIHRVGRTGRAGAAGVASTFATSAERNSIRAIERTLKMTLTRRDLPEGIVREDRSAAAVIVMPTRHEGSRHETSRNDASPAKRFGSKTSFSFKPRRSRFAAGR